MEHTSRGISLSCLMAAIVSSAFIRWKLRLVKLVLLSKGTFSHKIIIPTVATCVTVWYYVCLSSPHHFCGSPDCSCPFNLSSCTGTNFLSINPLRQLTQVIPLLRWLLHPASHTGDPYSNLDSCDFLFCVVILQCHCHSRLYQASQILVHQSACGGLADWSQAVVVWYYQYGLWVLPCLGWLELMPKGLLAMPLLLMILAQLRAVLR